MAHLLALLLCSSAVVDVLEPGKPLAEPVVSPVAKELTVEILVSTEVLEARFQEKRKAFGKPGDATIKKLADQVRDWKPAKSELALVITCEADVPVGTVLAITDACKAVGITKVTFRLADKPEPK